MKVLRIALTVLLSGASIFWLSCAAKSSSTLEAQLATIQRGDLTNDITGTGNLVLSQKEDLAFEMAGTVAELLVEEGESVKEGQVLAKLDTSEWEDQLTSLEQQLTTAKRQLTAKERQLVVKERQVTAAERQVTTKEIALRQAQINLQTAERNLSVIADVKKVQDAIDDAEYDLKNAETMRENALKVGAPVAEVNFWSTQITSAKTRLAEAQQELKEILAGSSVKITTDVAIEVATKQLQVEQAQRQVEDGQIAIADARTAVEEAQIAVAEAKLDVEEAQKAVDKAKKALDEAKKTSPEVKASFAGFITKINVKGGDEVKKGTVAMTLADPTKFEATVLVSERDMFQVRIGGDASVQVDAMPTLNLPAKVTYVAPTATIQQGVVNFKVTVELQSLEALAQERPAALPETRQEVQQGELPERLKQAIEEGRITRQQAEEMMKRIPQAQWGDTPALPTLTQQALPGLTQAIQLKEGLSVTVSLVIAQKNNVLLVPNSAITSQGRETVVQVLKNGIAEPRTIKTGISNWQYTEVTDGLTEGEQVIITKATSTTTPTQQRGPSFFPGGMMR